MILPKIALKIVPKFAPKIAPKTAYDITLITQVIIENSAKRVFTALVSMEMLD